MSSDLETVRAAYEAWNRADGSFFEYLDPEIEWIPPDNFVGGPVKGHDEVRRLADSVTQSFEEMRWIPVDILEGAEQGQVVAVLDNETRGKGSGAELKVRVAHVWRLRDGKIFWGKSYPDAAEGLRAAGREPSG